MDLLNAPVEIFRELFRSSFYQNLQLQADANKEKDKKEEGSKGNIPNQSPSVNIEDIIDTIEEGG